jgi:hypothetical protein
MVALISAYHWRRVMPYRAGSERYFSQLLSVVLRGGGVTNAAYHVVPPMGQAQAQGVGGDFNMARKQHSTLRVASRR